MDRLDVTYQRAFMATPKDKYYNALLDTLVKDNNLKGEPLSNQKIQKAVSDVIKETEAEFERNYNTDCFLNLLRTRGMPKEIGRASCSVDT